MNVKRLKKIKNKLEENIFYKILRFILYAFVVLLLLVIIVQRVSNNDLSVSGYRIFMVVSGSMKGEYDIGDILVSKAVSEDEIKVGDNVTYLGKEGSLQGLIVTHKVIKINEEEGKKKFTTQGIANIIADPEIEYDQIYGKVIYKTMILSLFGKIMLNRIWGYILFIVVGIIVSIEIVSSIFSHDEDEG